MPIIENDPWREQYFERVWCPKGVVIPTDDGDAYNLFPKERWVYNKLLIAESQNLRCAARLGAAAIPGVFEADIQHARHGRGQLHYPVA